MSNEKKSQAEEYESSRDEAKDDTKKQEEAQVQKPQTAKRDAPISTTSAADMPVGKVDLHKIAGMKTGEEQKWNDATSIPMSPIRRGETRREENKSEGEWDTGLNEPVSEGSEDKNIGKL